MIPQFAKELLGSKKFWMTIGGSCAVTAVTVALSALGVPKDVIMIAAGAVGGLFGVNINAQGGIDKAKVENGEGK